MRSARMTKSMTLTTITTYPLHALTQQSKQHTPAHAHMPKERFHHFKPLEIFYAKASVSYKIGYFLII